MAELQKREPVQVTIGSLKMYCDSVKFSGETAVYERPSITGVPLFMNKCCKMTHISFTGRVYEPLRPLHTAGLANNLNGVGDYDIIYRDLKFRSCMITGFSAEDTGEEYINLTVHVVAKSTVLFV